MIGIRLRPRQVALLLVAVFALAASSSVTASAAVLDSGIVVRAEGRAPIQGGRVDTAYRQALDEAFRRGLLEALRILAPERQSPHDLETWQETVLSRAADFVGAWHILAQEEKDGFLTLETEIEVWREKLARASRTSGASAGAPAVRLVVLAGGLPLVDGAADEEIDAGRVAAAALEAELARRGAIIVATTDRAPRETSGAAAEEDRAALAAAVARRLAADAVLIVQLTRRGEGLVLAVQLVATASTTTLVSSRADVVLRSDRSLAEDFAPAARQLAAACAPSLATVRSARGRGSLP